MKVIAAIDLMDGKVVRLIKGDPMQRTIYGNNPVATAKKWQDEGADIIHLVDLDAALGVGSNFSMMREIASVLDIPVQAAGGLRSTAALEVAAGFARRVVVGTMAFRDRPGAEAALSRLGAGRLVVSVDHRGGRVAVAGWREDAGVGLLDAVHDFMESGFSEFLLTDVERDGTMGGPDLEWLAVVKELGANVIASGGISEADDIRAVAKIDPYGVILGKALYEGRITIPEARAAC